MTITLTTDFGQGSPYVAEMKAAILRANRAAGIVDISHSIPPQDVRQAADVISRVCPQFPAGTIHVAVIDPGVGTERRIVLVEAAGQRIIGPDNGLFSGLARQRRIEAAYEVSERRLWAREVSATFHGRDIMAPVAANLSLGSPTCDVGPAIEPDSLVLIDWPRPALDGDTLRGEIASIDSFGNLITNIARDDLPENWDLSSVTVHCGNAEIPGIVRTYGEQPEGELIALFGSGGVLELACVNGSAARQTTLDSDRVVRLTGSSI